jgi:hypothetical protein
MSSAALIGRDRKPVRKRILGVVEPAEFGAPKVASLSIVLVCFSAAQSETRLVVKYYNASVLQQV